MSRKFLLSVLLAALTLAACAPMHNANTQPATEALEGTYWKLMQLHGETVPVYEQQREPSLVLDSEHQRAGGSGGCNRYMGSYTLEDERISFGQIATTRMACAQGMETEAAFTDALTHVHTWQISGKNLKLYDRDGALLAEFLAQPLY